MTTNTAVDDIMFIHNKNKFILLTDFMTLNRTFTHKMVLDHKLISYHYSSCCYSC